MRAQKMEGLLSYTQSAFWIYPPTVDVPVSSVGKRVGPHENESHRRRRSDSTRSRRPSPLQGSKQHAVFSNKGSPCYQHCFLQLSEHFPLGEHEIGGPGGGL